MTHTTDKDRAEFEAWLGIKPCGAAHDLAWAAWQAARRAQVVPQGYESGAMSGNRVTLFFDTQKNAASWFDGFCDGYDASAPQPPEANSAEFDRIKAAHVQMPSPAECNTMDCQAGN